MVRCVDRPQTSRRSSRGLLCRVGRVVGETAICIVDDAGGIVREARVASEPEALVAFFAGCGMTMERVGLEACSLTAWLHGGLTEAGLPAICIEARQAKAAMGAMPNKADRNDARGLAQIMRTGWYRAVHVKSPACRSWRALLTARRMVLNKRRDVENGLRALLREVGAEGRHTEPQGLSGACARADGRRPGAGKPGRIAPVRGRGDDQGSGEAHQAGARRGEDGTDVPAADDSARASARSLRWRFARRSISQTASGSRATWARISV